MIKIASLALVGLLIRGTLVVAPVAPVVDHISLLTTPVWLYQGSTPVSVGTGFYFAKKIEPGKEFVCLVTNHHVLTGFAPADKKPPRGDRVEIYFHRRSDVPGDRKKISLPLYNRHKQPLWLNSQDSPEADVAVIPLPANILADTHVAAISEEWAQPTIRVRPTSRITFVGYPYGFYDQKNGLPIWKTGSIATEPSVDFDGKPLFLADISAFPGMSGSPVFAISYGAYETEDGATTVGGVRRFLGIFASLQMVESNKYLEQLISGSPSARYGIKDQQSLQIGHVWKAKLIIEMINKIDVEEYQKKLQ